MLKKLYLKTAKILGLSIALAIPAQLNAAVPLGNTCVVSKPGDSPLDIGSFRHILEHEYNPEINCFDEVRFNSSATINMIRTHEIFNTVEYFKEYKNPDMNNKVGQWMINGNGHNVILDATTNSFDSFWDYAMLIRVYDSTVTLKDITIRVDQCKNAVKVDTQGEQIFKQKYPNVPWEDNLPSTTLVYNNFHIESNDGLNPDKDPFCDPVDLCPNDFSNTNIDSDGDGNGDVCDKCPGFDDGQDTDNDGVPNGCDICADGNDNVDSDGDNVPDACDKCPGFNDGQDADNDGVPDACDICADGNDNVDQDNDGVPNACDICPGGDDNKDTDNDGKPDSCDPCPYIKWTDICDIQVLDSDDDGVPDGADNCPQDANPMQEGSDGDGHGDDCDICQGFDDKVDTDGDFQPDGCDVCAGADDFIDLNNNGKPDGCDDADGDDVPNKDDICPNGDDNVDENNDGVPDACQDTDGDDVPDSEDKCPGFDDNVDLNNNGIPDGCEDDDGDDVPNKDDICPNGDDNVDENNDGVPDACEKLQDSDGDGFPDSEDICPNGDDSLDFDGDQIPDDCDNCPLVPNTDQDPDACAVAGDENIPGDDVVSADSLTGAGGCSLANSSVSPVMLFNLVAVLGAFILRRKIKG